MHLNLRYGVGKFYISVLVIKRDGTIYSIFKIYFKAQTLPVDRMLIQPVSPKATK